jgi:prepilin-type N-terminal cleavage/methylation domain-containing protein
MTNVEKVPAARGRHSGFVIDSSSIIRQPHRSRAKVAHSSFTARSAFTLIELIVVVTIITILAGLVLSTAGYARKKGARARAETEIAAMSAACESYKADNGVYPRDPTANTATDALNARTMIDPATTNAALYRAASLVLYRALSGDRNLDRAVTVVDENYNIDGNPLSPPLTQLPQAYFAFKPNMLSPSGGSGTVTAIADPFGNTYGYSTANQYDPNTGYNPTFDLWSTAGVAPSPTPAPPATQQDLWIKNW